MKVIYFISILTIIASCNSNKNNSNKKPEVVVMDTVSDAPSGNDADSVITIKNNPLLWHAKDSIGLKLYKPTTPGIDSMSTINIIQLINNNDDAIKMEYVKTSHDTIYVHIINSAKLTNSIGNTRAEMYMASTTYSLTELKGIKYVSYDFIEGDHASPGVYDRSSFKNFNR